MRYISFIVKIVSIYFFTCYCVGEEHPELKFAIDKAVAENPSIVVINVSKLQDKSIQKLSLDDQVYYVLSQIEKLKPKLVFLDILLDDPIKEIDIEILRNKHSYLVSLYRLQNHDGISANQINESLIGSKIGGHNRFEEENPLKYNFIKLPNINIVGSSDRLCTYFFGQNPDNKHIEYMLPIYQFGDFFLESCSLVISNILLDKYGINISYSNNHNRYEMFSYMKNQFGSIKYLDDYKFKKESKKKVEFRKVPEYFSINELKAANIPDNSIFIISENLKFTTSIGSIGSAQILASEIYTLFNSLKVPLTFFNKIDRNIIYAKP